MNSKQVNDIKNQLWAYYQKLLARWEETKSQIAYHKWCGIADEYRFCQEEIAYWKRVADEL